MNEKAIEAAHDAAKAAARSIGLNVDTMTDGEITGSEIAVIIRAAIAAYDATARSPVAWRYKSEAPGGKSEWSLTQLRADIDTLSKMPFMRVEPLYALTSKGEQP